MTRARSGFALPCHWGSDVRLIRRKSR